MRRARLVLVLTAVTASVALTAVAHAERKPTTKERIQIASVIHLPAACAHVRVATTSHKPKWGKVSWRNGGSQCTALASNGVTIVHKSSGRWRVVTAGSSFTCSELYAQVPRPVANDLKISCVKA